MNAGNSPGIAEALALNILPKLKNVKTKDNSSNLLRYLLSVYVKKCDKVIGTVMISIPQAYQGNVKSQYVSTC